MSLAYAGRGFDALPGVAYDFCVGKGAHYPISFMGEWSGTLVRDEYSPLFFVKQDEAAQRKHCPCVALSPAPSPPP